MEKVLFEEYRHRNPAAFASVEEEEAGLEPVMSKWAKQHMNKNSNNDDSKECKSKLWLWVTS